MKKFLQLCFMCLLVSAVGLSLGSCKDENEGSGSPNPLLGMQVDLSDIDSTAVALVDIDQANKLITVSLSKTIADLSAVPVTFDLVNGAYLYTPYVTNPVIMDLSEETGVNIATGDNIVFYKLVAKEDEALVAVKASAGGIEGTATINQASKLIDIYFGDNEVDLTNVTLDFEISPVSSMVTPSTPSITMDLSADTTLIEVYNEFKGNVQYKIICWNNPKDGIMTLKEYADVDVTESEGEYKIQTTGENPAIISSRYPVSMGMVIGFEYKSDVDLGRPVFSLDLNNKDLQIKGYELDASSEWKTMAIDISPLYFDAAKVLGSGYTIHVALGEEVPVGSNIEIRNFTVRERNYNEEMQIAQGYWMIFDGSGSGNRCTVTNLTSDDNYPTVQFVCSDAKDPYWSAKAHDEEVTVDMNQIYFYYKSETSFQQQVYFQAIDDTWSFRFADDEDATQKPELRYTYEPSDIWVCVHFDASYAFQSIFEEHPNAGEGGVSIRWDPEQIGTLNVPIIYRNIRFVKASYE